MEPVPGRTHDVQVTDDGKFLLTADEVRCGGHLLVWDIQEVLAACDPNCAEDAVPPVAIFRPNSILPSTIHKIRLDGNFAYITWYEEGLQILDLANLPGFLPSAPLLTHLGSYDTLVPNNPDTMQNAGIFSAWGVALDGCRLHVSDWGNPPDGGNPQPARYRILRYSGGPEPNQPLLVRKQASVPGGINLLWGQVPLSDRFSLYRGTLDAFRTPAHYDHQMVGPVLCSRPGNLMPVDSQYPTGTSYYYLLTARNACGDPEGNYGYASDGTLRPTPSDLGLPGCP